MKEKFYVVIYWDNGILKIAENSFDCRDYVGAMSKRDELRDTHEEVYICEMIYG